MQDDAPDLPDEIGDEDEEGLGPDPESLILIVVGAHLRAELADRPLADRLRERMRTRLAERYGPEEAGGHPLTPLVCTDVWYLNDERLRERPTVSIGGPGVNALSAYLADKLPSAFVVDDVLMVQLDVGFDELLACAWGTDHRATVAAVEAFMDRYLDAFMEAACGG